MTPYHFIGAVDVRSDAEGDGFRAIVHANVLRIEGAEPRQVKQFEANFSGDDERETLAAAIRSAAEVAMAWCERENIGGRLQ